jgi:hypothetical protein
VLVPIFVTTIVFCAGRRAPSLRSIAPAPYTSAVSNRVMPSSTARSMVRSTSASMSGP